MSEEGVGSNHVLEGLVLKEEKGFSHFTSLIVFLSQIAKAAENHSLIIKLCQFNIK